MARRMITHFILMVLVDSSLQDVSCHASFFEASCSPAWAWLYLYPTLLSLTAESWICTSSLSFFFFFYFPSLSVSCSWLLYSIRSKHHGLLKSLSGQEWSWDHIKAQSVEHAHEHPPTHVQACTTFCVCWCTMCAFCFHQLHSKSEFVHSLNCQNSYLGSIGLQSRFFFCFGPPNKTVLKYNQQ